MHGIQQSEYAAEATTEIANELKTTGLVHENTDCICIYTMPIGVCGFLSEIVIS